MKLLMMGPQGAGKGTQGELLAEALSLPHIATGDIFRANVGNGTALGRTAQSFISRGDLVPDEVTLQMVAGRLAEPDATRGWVLDGFPRTVDQAGWLDRLCRDSDGPLTAVILLEVPDEVLLERMVTRGRADDRTAVIRRRLDLYHRETAPILEHLGELVVAVDGVGSFTDVARRVMAGIGRSPLTMPAPRAPLT